MPAARLRGKAGGGTSGAQRRRRGMDLNGISAIVTKSGMQRNFEAKVAKVDTKHGLVFGFAVICKKNGQRYFDLQDEHVPEPVMFDFTVDFMKNSRTAKAMHDGDAVGEVLFAFPLTTEVAKALGISTEQTGLIIGMKPNAETLKKFEDGEFTGFSIGGYATYQDADEDVAKADELADMADEVCEGCEEGCEECTPEDDDLEDEGEEDTEE
jgi:hypothetical protein